jgi:LysM repeat protein
MSIRLPEPHLSALKAPSTKFLLIAGGAIILLVIALWSITKSKLGQGLGQGASVATDASVPNGLNADASAATPTPVVLPPASTTPTPTVPTPPPASPTAPTPVVSAPSLPGQSYVVMAGDTLNAIARKFGIGTLTLGDYNKATLDSTAAQHGIGGTSGYGSYDKAYDYIYAGEVLRIPG